MADDLAKNGGQILLFGAPILFVFLWSKEFISVKYGLPYAEPMTVVFLQFAIAIALVAFWTVLIRSDCPSLRLTTHTDLAGLCSANKCRNLPY